MAEKDKMLFQRDITSPREEDLEVAMSVSPSPNSFWRPTKGLLSLLSINLVVCSVEMVASCSFTFIPPLLLRSQFSEFVMNIILGIGPLIAVVTVPAFAAWSDQSSRSFQRRRLLIFWCLLALTAALVLIPSSHRISFLLLGDPAGRLQMFILATAVILLDYVFKVIFNPCEALFSVVMASYSKGSQTLGFTMHSACMSLGCIIGFLIVCVEWTAVFGLDLHQDQMCFLVAIVLLMPCVVVMRPNKGVGPKPQNHELPLKCDMAVNSRNSFVKNVTQTRLNNNHEAYQVPMTNRTIFRKFSVSSVAINVSVPFAKFLKIIVEKLIYIVGKILFVPIECYGHFRCSPSVIQRMFMFEIFGWTAVLCHDRFLTDFFGQYVFKGDPNAVEGSTQAKLYDEGIRIGSWSLFLQSLSAPLLLLKTAG